MRDRWGLSIGEDSREFLLCRGGICETEVDTKRWKHVKTMKCLGHHLQDDGGIQECYVAVASSMWRAFCGNLSASLLLSSENVRMRFLKSSIVSVASSRWARWPYQRSFADKLGRVQRKMIANLMNIKPVEGEAFDAFCQRRHIVTGIKTSKVGRWSQQWAASIDSWAAHIDRKHDDKAWSHVILGWHDGMWLQWQRFLQSSGHESRTRTRAVRGKVHRRWEEGLEEARAVLPCSP